ncbi:MAG: TatD family hydrolase [Labilithrix sp.]|nr:TatD family hydrolase [Labilithrix sp.]
MATTPESTPRLDFEYVDAHCHVDLFPSPAELVAEANAERVFTIAVTNAPFVFDHTRSLARGSALVHPALGLHPELVHSHGRQLATLCERLEEVRFVGEVGLDYSTSDHALRAEQRRVFDAVLEACARVGGKVLTIHSRRAAGDVVAAIGRGSPGRVILHWFTGTVRELERAVAAGAYFSVNVAMFESKNGRSLISAMPRERVVTESDGPFVRRAGEPASPRGMRAVVELLAREWRLPTGEAARVIRTNFESCAGPLELQPEKRHE